MAKTLQSYTKYREYRIDHPLKGVFIDPNPTDVPVDGWRKFDHFHVRDGRVEELAGWKPLPLDSAFSSPNPLIFGRDFEQQDTSRSFIVADKTDIYYYDRVLKTISSIVSGFTGANTDRWQSAVFLNNLYLVNGIDAIQKYQGSTSIAPLGGDAAMPQTAKYIASVAGHLCFAYTKEGGQYYPRRFRWGDLDFDGVYVRTDVNEPGFIDLPDDIGFIQGMEILGPNGVVIYGTKSIYILTYVGLPYIWLVERKVTGEGLFAPYSLCSFEDRQFFRGKQDFYEYSGGAELKPLGRDRVADFFFADSKSESAFPKNVYGFVHPQFTEIWWVYASGGGTVFDSALIYNWMNGAWATRGVEDRNFNHSFICEFLTTELRTFDQITTLWQDAIGTWRDKQGKGTWIVVSGD